MEEQSGKNNGHILTVRERKTGNLTGVLEVCSFDEKEVLLETRQGALAVRGSGLSITKLDLERGEADIKGEIDSMTYAREGTFGGKKGKAVLARLFK